MPNERAFMRRFTSLVTNIVCISGYFSAMVKVQERIRWSGVASEKASFTRFWYLSPVTTCSIPRLGPNEAPLVNKSLVVIASNARTNSRAL